MRKRCIGGSGGGSEGGGCDWFVVVVVVDDVDVDAPPDAAMEFSDMAADILVSDSKPNEEEVFVPDDDDDGRRCFAEVNAAGNE